MQQRPLVEFNEGDAPMRAMAPLPAVATLSGGSTSAGVRRVKEVRMLFWPGGAPSTKFVTPDMRDHGPSDLRGG